MILRTKSGEFKAANSNVLFEFLGVKKDAVGVQKVAGDVALIAGVPFAINNEQLSMNNEEKTKGIAWTLSTLDLDRFGERIDPKGWDFTQFIKNPVVEWSHNFLIPAIGKIEGLTIDDDGLHGTVIFNGKEYDPFGWAIGERVKNGVICAGSVGFRVIEIEIPDKETAKDGTRLIFRKQELLEFSVCNVPANPHALAKAGNRELGVGNVQNAAFSENAAHFWGGLIHSVQGV